MDRADAPGFFKVKIKAKEGFNYRFKVMQAGDRGPLWCVNEACEQGGTDFRYNIHTPRSSHVPDAPDRAPTPNVSMPETTPAKPAGHIRTGRWGRCHRHCARSTAHPRCGRFPQEREVAQPDTGAARLFVPGADG